MLSKVDEPMDSAVLKWKSMGKYLTDKIYRDQVNELVEIGDRMHRREAKELLDACEKLHPTEIYDLVESMRPSSYVISHLVMMAKELQKRQTAIERANSRHAENHAMKAEVFTWLDSNMVNFKSMEKAAEAIAGKIAPIAVRTARDWVGEWKKLRSASTP